MAGAQAVRGELADYLAGDPDIGVAASGLARDAFEEVRAEEERWQADRAGNQAAAVAAPMVRGVDDDPALRVISRVSSVKRAFADAGRALRHRYLTGDLSGGADPTTAGNLLSATATRELGSSRSESVQMYRRRMEVGKAVSGLPDDAAVERVLRIEAHEEALRGSYNAVALGARFTSEDRGIGRDCGRGAGAGQGLAVGVR